MQIRQGKRYLYYLSENENNRVFYIGLTSNPKNRYLSHTYNYGQNITMNVFKEAVGWVAETMESFVIKKAARIGFKLTNSLTCLVSSYETEDTLAAFSSFQESIMMRHLIESEDGLKFLNFYKFEL